MDDDIIIPIDVIENEYPELVIKVGLDKICKGIIKNKEVRYKREIKLKLLLNE